MRTEEHLDCFLWRLGRLGFHPSSARTRTRYNAAVPIIRVDVLKQPYEVIVEPGILARVGQRVKELTACKRCCVVTDDHVAPLHLDRLQASFGADVDLVDTVIPSGEE